MIILFAMINSLAARDKALREATTPLDRAAWGVYVGDGKKGKEVARAAGESSSDATASQQHRVTATHCAA
jgi:hypothetical protein